MCVFCVLMVVLFMLFCNWLSFIIRKVVCKWGGIIINSMSVVLVGRVLKGCGWVFNWLLFLVYRISSLVMSWFCRIFILVFGSICFGRNGGVCRRDVNEC